MQLKAVSDRILIRKDIASKQTFGDGKYIILDADAEHQAYFATVVDVGPGRWTDDEETFLKPTVNIGDRVLVAGHAVGHPLPRSVREAIGERYAFVFEEEILARIGDQRVLVATEQELTELIGSDATRDLLLVLESNRA